MMSTLPDLTAFATPLRLVSHPLCPYVQRALIVAAETSREVERIYIDLANKPEWFVALSPTGKVPLLQVGSAVLFASAAICEYLDETGPGTLMPSDPLARARHRAWVEFASGTLDEIAGLYSASTEAVFQSRRTALSQRFERLEEAIAGPWFGGKAFGLVDAAFAPVFRYLDAFEGLAGLHLADQRARLGAWRAALALRPSVRDAVSPDYPETLQRFLVTRGSCLSAAITAGARPDA